MTAHHGEGCVGEVAHSDVLVGVAQPGETHLDEHLLGAGVVDLELLDLPRGVDFVGDGGTCLHGEKLGGEACPCHTSGRTTIWTGERQFRAGGTDAATALVAVGRRHVRAMSSPLAYALCRAPGSAGEAALAGSFAHRVLELLMQRDPLERTVEVAKAIAALSGLASRPT